MKIIKILTLLLIILLAIFLRFYKLTANPPHLYWDEASINYNAYAVNQTGEDEWGNHDPFLFKSFGDYKLPLYIYLTAVSQRFLGLTDLAVRAPSALAGFLTVVIVFFLTQEEIYLICDKHKQFPFINNPTTIALCASFFLAISPWALQFSRAGFEANVALFCRTAGAFFFLLGMRKKKFWYLFPALFFIAASVYTYHSAAVTAPLILFMLVFIFRQELLANLKKVIWPFLFLVIIILPYLPSYIFSAQGRTRFTGEVVTNMSGNPVTNFVNNYVANFSLDYLFFHGDQNGRQSVKKLGELYLWQLPTILAGAYFLLRYRSKASLIIFSWVLIGSLPPALTVVSPHALRGLLAVRSWQTLSAIGFVFLLSKINPKWRLLSIPVIVYALLLYLHIYYVHYPKAYAADWQDGERQAVTFVKNIQADYQNIFVYQSFDPIYILLYWPIDPQKLIASHHDTTKMGKISYFDYANLPTSENFPGKNLLLVPAWFKYDDTKLLRQINMAGGEAVYKIYEL